MSHTRRPEPGGHDVRVTMLELVDFTEWRQVDTQASFVDSILTPNICQNTRRRSLYCSHCRTIHSSGRTLPPDGVEKRFTSKRSPNKKKAEVEERSAKEAQHRSTLLTINGSKVLSLHRATGSKETKIKGDRHIVTKEKQLPKGQAAFCSTCCKFKPRSARENEKQAINIVMPNTA